MGFFVTGHGISDGKLQKSTGSVKEPTCCRFASLLPPIHWNPKNSLTHPAARLGHGLCPCVISAPTIPYGRLETGNHVLVNTIPFSWPPGLERSYPDFSPPCPLAPVDSGVTPSLFPVSIPPVSSGQYAIGAAGRHAPATIKPSVFLFPAHRGLKTAAQGG